MITIDLKDPSALTTENVARLIASQADDRHWQLRVSKDGIAYLSEVIGNNDLDGLAFRFETWCQGNGYVGPEAARDETWVAEVYRDLKENWPAPKSRVIDY